MKSIWLCAVALGALSLASASLAAEKSTSNLQPSYGAWGFDATGAEMSVKPGDDFFTYANGTWIKRTKIPADKTSYGAFDTLADLSEARVHTIAEQAAAGHHTVTTPEGKVGGAYAAFMNEGRVEKLGAAPLKSDLDAIRAVKDRAALSVLMGRSPRSFVSSVVDVDIQPDFKDPKKYNVYISQGGLGLPDRDYYLTAQFAEKKKAYEAYVARMLTFAGWAEPQARAAEIVVFETKLAEVSWSRAEQRDPVKLYNPTSVAELEKTMPGFAWRGFMRSADLGGATTVISTTNTSIPKIVAIYDATSLETLKAWEAFHVVDAASPYLSSAFAKARFDFRNKALSGQLEITPRWKRGVRAVNGALGEAVGQVYVARYFPPQSKAKMEALIGDLKAAFHDHIEHLDWMSAATKDEAQKKLANYDVQIGYPKKWRDYSALEIRADDLYGNIARSSAFEWAYKANRVNNPVDKDEWDLTPQTVNAYNQPFFNEVVFPAAILQPPFFNPKADPAINYGAIGGVIGHEMTHGFDDAGRKFDDKGRLRDWWTAQDAERFDAKAKVLGAQYSAIEPLPGAHIKGDNTMGENIADLGGLTLGLAAYHASLHGQPAPVIDGLTGDQRVFLGWAQVWREKLRDDALRQQIASNEHSPPEARVNAVVHNIDAWYAAFNVKPTDKLYVAPDKRVRIW